jgi:hypothetical protein
MRRRSSRSEDEIVEPRYAKDIAANTQPGIQILTTGKSVSCSDYAQVVQNLDNDYAYSTNGDERDWKPLATFGHLSDTLDLADSKHDNRSRSE